jgi:hypothetical protein
MTEDSAKTAVMNSWSILIEQTRHALATLRAEDLEELSERAEGMSDVNAGAGSHLRHQEGIHPVELADVMREHRLLGDLLVVTDRNFKFLRRLQGRNHDSMCACERDIRWVL